MTKYEMTANLLGLKLDETAPELQNLVIQTRASISGASDPWTIDRLNKVKDVLLYRTQNWTHTSDIIDCSIYIMCLECIKLIMNELEERLKSEKLS